MADLEKDSQESQDYSDSDDDSSNHGESSRESSQDTGIDVEDNIDSQFGDIVDSSEDDSGSSEDSEDEEDELEDRPQDRDEINTFPFDEDPPPVEEINIDELERKKGIGNSQAIALGALAKESRHIQAQGEIVEKNHREERKKVSKECQVSRAVLYRWEE